MKYLVPFLVLWSSNTFAVEQDKLLHATASYAATVTGAAMFETLGVKTAPITSAVLVFFAGAVKELTDPVFSSDDMKANAVGCGAATISYTIVF